MSEGSPLTTGLELPTPLSHRRRQPDRSDLRWPCSNSRQIAGTCQDGRFLGQRAQTGWSQQPSAGPAFQISPCRGDPSRTL